jgi:predicted GNAT family N-acyltransferase
MSFNFHHLIENFELRELKSETDIVDHLALRREIYKKEYSREYTDNQYDLLPSDWKANLIGIYSMGEQIATIRVVKRTVNSSIEKQLRNINQKFHLQIQPDLSSVLPTEYAFDISSHGCAVYNDATVELSRVAVADAYRGIGLCRFAMLAAIGISILDKAEYCLYSCSTGAVKFHEDLVPMMENITAMQKEYGYPGFKFPTSSAAVLSSIQHISQKQMNQAILAGTVCRYGIGVLGDNFFEKTNAAQQLPSFAL